MVQKARQRLRKIHIIFSNWGDTRYLSKQNYIVKATLGYGAEPFQIFQHRRHSVRLMKGVETSFWAKLGGFINVNVKFQLMPTAMTMPTNVKALSSCKNLCISKGLRQKLLFCH